LGQNVNCKSFEGRCRCSEKRVKKSFFGLGARLCLELGEGKRIFGACPFKKEHKRPKPSINPHPKRNEIVVIIMPQK
jgi:hypothetical protein